MSNFRNAVRRRAHPERAQPSSRAHMGLLEKHSDYLLRARNYHAKQDRLQQLREAARLRNPDEFYHRMEREGEGVKDGRHVIERRGVKRSAAQLKRMKEQDFNYAVMQRQQERRHIDRVRATLHGLEDAPPAEGAAPKEDVEEKDADDDDEADDGEPSSPSPATRRRHVIFADDGRTASFSPAEHFHTVPSLLSRTHNRPTLSQLASTPLTVTQSPAASLAQVDRARQRTYAALDDRLRRLSEVESEVARLQRQRVLMGKGKRRKETHRDKFGDVDESKTVFVWKQERKK